MLRFLFLWLCRLLRLRESFLLLFRRSSGRGWRSPRRGVRRVPSYTRPMIEQLVEQIETRFAELEREMSDPEVIADRERYAEVGRAYRELEGAARLAPEWSVR